VQGETKKYSRMHGAWCVGLIAGDNPSDNYYVAVGSQRVAQEVRLTILMFVFDSLLVTLSLEFPIRALSSLDIGA
jgi:hypothetical protein